MARANPSIVDAEDRTPIHLAAERGHTAIVDFLADKFKVGKINQLVIFLFFLMEYFQSSVYSRAKNGSTLLHVAALHGHSETAMVLHKRGVPLLMPNR
jgi:ankyrin repeat protein